MTAPAPTDAAALREANPYGIIDPDYARVFTIARCIAWQEGYALVMHGSFTRDLDLLAVPWAEKATDAEHLVRRIELALDDLDILIKDPAAPSQATERPHGRLAWTLTFKAFGDPRFVDLSVMPRATTTDAALASALETNRELHRRAQKAEGFKARHRGFNYLLNRRLEDRRARRKAEADLARALDRIAGLEAALEASEYLAGRYRALWQGKPVRDLTEAEAANATARDALTDGASHA